jgi:hypothetical protein
MTSSILSEKRCLEGRKKWSIEEYLDLRRDDAEKCIRKSLYLICTPYEMLLARDWQNTKPGCGNEKCIQNYRRKT